MSGTASCITPNANASQPGTVVDGATVSQTAQPCVSGRHPTQPQYASARTAAQVHTVPSQRPLPAPAAKHHFAASAAAPSVGQGPLAQGRAAASGATSGDERQPAPTEATGAFSSGRVTHVGTPPLPAPSTAADARLAETVGLTNPAPPLLVHGNSNGGAVTPGSLRRALSLLRQPQPLITHAPPQANSGSQQHHLSASGAVATSNAAVHTLVPPISTTAVSQHSADRNIYRALMDSSGSTPQTLGQEVRQAVDGSPEVDVASTRQSQRMRMPCEPEPKVSMQAATQTPTSTSMNWDAKNLSPIKSRTFASQPRPLARQMSLPLLLHSNRPPNSNHTYGPNPAAMEPMQVSQDVRQASAVPRESCSNRASSNGSPPSPAFPVAHHPENNTGRRTADTFVANARQPQ
ncbi:MAG: hypothetical protein WDW36_002314 [Sanguina aurantia]